MYRYDNYDQALVDERVAQFRDQVARWKSGELSDEEFRPLRLQNGLYVQRHAPMFRVAVPYGMLSSPQMRCLALLGRASPRLVLGRASLRFAALLPLSRRGQPHCGSIAAASPHRRVAASPHRRTVLPETRRVSLSASVVARHICRTLGGRGDNRPMRPMG